MNARALHIPGDGYMWGTCRRLDPAHSAGLSNDLVTASGMYLLVDFLDVGVDGMRADKKVGCDFLIGKASFYLAKDFFFTGR